MSLNLTAAYKIKKRPSGSAASRKNPLNQLHKKSASSSPRKPSSHASTPISSIQDDDTFGASLWSLGWPTDQLEPSETLPTTVEEAIGYILANQFTPLPPTLVGLGLSREGVAEILNFRKSLSPVIPINHIHSMLPSRTETERTIAALVADGTLRRVQIKTGNTTYLEGVIQTDEFLKSIAQSSHLDAETKDAFLTLFENDPSLAMVTSDESDNNSSPSLPKSVIMNLLSAGFLTINSNQASSATNIDIAALTPTTAMKTIVTLPQKDNTHLSTLESLSSIFSSSNRKANNNAVSISSKSSVEYIITPPNLGLLTHLYGSSKSRMLDILRKCPHREATMLYLRERWDGGVSKGKNKRASKHEVAKFEGRTRKWKDFKGVTVEWVIGGLMGAGVVENFEAIGMGMGVRLAKGN